MLAISFLFVAPVGCGSGETDSTRGAASKAVLESRSESKSESTSESEWILLPAPRLESAVGYRDGARTRARFVFRIAEGDALQVDVLTEQTPTPKLVRGSWSRRGSSQEAGGVVEADDLHFLGGQGGRPSLGGRLVLLDSDLKEVLRLAFPPLELEPIRPGGLGSIDSDDPR